MSKTMAKGLEDGQKEIKKEIKRLQKAMAANPRFSEMYLQLIKEELAKLI